MKYYQTGDVLYKQIDKKPKGFKKAKGNLIHKGNSHNHTISGNFELFLNKSEMLINAKGICKLLHPEHKTIVLPKGLYKKDILQEYDHFLEESRKVID